MTPKFVMIFRMFMAICLVVLSGCVIYFKDYSSLTDVQTYAFSGLLFVYGLFRVYRAYKASDDIFVEK